MSKTASNRYVTEEQVAEARMKIMEQAKAKGIKPFQGLDPKFAEIADDESVDEFNEQIRKWRRESLVDK